MTKLKLYLINILKYFLEAINWFLLKLVRPLWLGAVQFWGIVGPTRFSALTIVTGGLLLFTTRQGKELTARVMDDDAPLFGWLVIAVLWLAIQSWYWARAVLLVPNMPSRPNTEYGEVAQNSEALFWKEWLPRIYAGTTFVLATTALFAQGMTTYSMIMGGVGIITLLLLIIRRPAWKMLSVRSNIVAGSHAKRVSFFTSFATKLDWVMWISSFVFALVSFTIFTFFPVYFGNFFGATAIAFFAFGNLIPIGNYLVHRSKEIGIPVISLIALCAAASSFFNDNHEIPLLSKPAERLNIEQAVAKWLEKNTKEGDKTIPMVLVSTAGGGLRAAYWTASILGNLQDRCQGFNQRTFSISSVSGGTLGAAVYSARTSYDARALKPVDLSKCKSVENIKSEENLVSTFTLKVLDQDFLGPTVATMLFPDLVQRLLPWSFLPSRGEVLSTAWAMSWAETCRFDRNCSPAQESILENAFLSLAPVEAEAWHPILLFNATHQETGKRFITSHLEVTRDVFFDAFDSHETLERDVALKTAVLNSARFTYVSPAGLLVDPNGKKLGHLLDGGYFENSGAVTTSELFLKLIEVLGKQLDQTKYAGVKIKPIIIQITSDPALEPDDFAAVGPKGSFLEMRPKPDRGLNELLAPILGILQTRTARGVLASKTMAGIVKMLQMEKDKEPQSVNDKEKEPMWFKHIVKPVFAHFEMCIDKAKGEVPPPLGWAMAKKSRTLISNMHLRNITVSDSETYQPKNRNVKTIRILSK